MKIYIDSDCKCHVTNDGTRTAVEDAFFDGKCVAFIEGHRFIPEGETLLIDGVVCQGQMISPFVDSVKLDAIQREYERQLIAMYEKSLNVVGVET